LSAQEREGKWRQMNRKSGIGGGKKGEEVKEGKEDRRRKKS
jgi:hypothetical protein